MVNPADHPRLPGFDAWDPVAVQKTRTARLVYKNGVPFINEDTQTPVSSFNLTAAQKRVIDGAGDPTVAAKVTQVTHWVGEDGGELPEVVPQWLAYDRRVLRFFAYFKEPVVESPHENFRIRKVTIYHYLEDDTTRMEEPREDNSGIPNGVFLKRHVVEMADGSPLMASAFNVGTDLTVYGRTFHIVGCDEFTREMLEADGKEVPENSTIPDDAHRVRMQKTVEMAKHHPKPTAKGLAELRKFFDNDRKVLRFYAVWDDTKSLYGDNLPYVVHYYLADDTIEINEVHSRNMGRDRFPKLLARGKLPRDYRQNGSPAYDWKDLNLGQTVSVWGRDLFLYDCDGFTREWFVRHGMEIPEEAIDLGLGYKLEVPEPPVNPDWYGIGTERDQLQSATMLIPKPPKFNWAQFMAYDGEVMRFAARLIEADGCKLLPSDDVREFVVTYFLSDDTIQIHEPPIRNSGIIGGKFLERSHVKKPTSATQEYRPRDLYLGAHLTTLSRCFLLFDADVHTLVFMEKNPDQFPQARREQVVDKVRGAITDVDAFKSAIGAKKATAMSIQKALAAGGATGVTLHEATTIARALGSPDGKHPVAAADVVATLCE